MDQQVSRSTLKVVCLQLESACIRHDQLYVGTGRSQKVIVRYENCREGAESHIL